MELGNFLKRRDACVYCFEFPNGKRYVGKTLDLGRRLSLYEKNVSGEFEDNSPVVRAIREFSWASIDFKILAKVEGLSKDDAELCLSILEIKYIREFGSISPSGYNISFGGECLGVPVEYLTTDKRKIDAFKGASKAVLLYDLEGKFVKEYPSIANMSYDLGIMPEEGSQKLDKKQVLCQKYFVRSKRYDYIPDMIEVPKVEVRDRVKYNTIVEERVVVKEKRVYKQAALAYDMNGDFVGEYESRADACRHLNGAKDMPWGRYVKGYILYKKVSDDYPKKIEGHLAFQGKVILEEYKPAVELADLPKQNIEPYNRKGIHTNLNLTFPVQQFDLGGNFIATHASIRDASVASGIPYSQIYACVHGKTKRARNYIWRKVDVDIAI